MNPFEFGKLLLAVHTERFPLVVGLRSDDVDVRLDREFDHVGQVVLTLRVVVLQRSEPAGQLRGRRNDDARVDLGDLLLLRRRVFLFDDTQHLAVRIAHDAAVAGRIVERHGEHAVAALPRAIGETPQRARARERHIAVQHERRHRRIQQRQCLLHRVAGAELLLLNRELHVGRRHGNAHRFGAMTNHDDEPCRIKRACSIDNVRQEWPAGQRMQHLGQRGTHALAGACRQNHDVHGVDEGSSLEPLILAWASRYSGRLSDRGDAGNA